MDCFILHIGAGRHSPKHRTQYKRLLKTALAQESLLDAAHIVERSPLTNTGHGASLDRLGHVACDASAICARNRRVETALALSNIRGITVPTRVCFRVLEWLDGAYAAESTSRAFGFLRPAHLDHAQLGGLVGEGELENCLSKMALRSYQRLNGLYTEGEAPDTRSLEDVSGVDDTVGYIWVQGPSMTLASSSGGNLFRMPGRVSCAGVTGAALGYARAGVVEVSCMCSGNGDDIVQMSLGSYLSDALAQRVRFLEDWPDLGALAASLIYERGAAYSLTAVNASGQEIVYVGVVCVVRAPEKCRLVYCHSTESFYFGFRDAGSVETVLSRQDKAGEFTHGEYRLRM